MKIPKTPVVLIGAAALVFSMSTPAVADDGGNGEAGKPILKSMTNMQQPTVDGYLDEAEHSFIAQMKFYVPMQSASGVTDDALASTGKADPRSYFDIDGAPAETRDLAKPLIGVSMYGPVETVEGVGFVGHGRRDAYASVSLDDGITWKETNLSESADATSCDNGNCNFTRTDIPLFDDLDGYYPGDVTNMYHAIAGNKVLVAWPSRYCAQGQPNYSLDNPDATDEQLARRSGIATYLGIDLLTASPDDLYLIDMYGVGGSQGSVNYAEEDDYEPNQAVGEVPYSCLWTARGELVNGDDPRTGDVTEASFMRWFNTERLTSGVRDVNRIETVCVDGAGCAITWQEDPDGLRGGQGEGPGEGWSGAVANSQTDVWYSYIDMERFDVVQDPADDTGATPMTFAAYEALAADDPDQADETETDKVTQKPKPFVPFAMPMRVTDNAKCNVTNPKPYCYGSALQGIVATENVPAFPDLDAVPTDYGLKDMCVAIVEVETGKQNPKTTELCVTEDDVTLVGNTAATRPRLAVYGYDSTSPKKLGDSIIDSGFVAIVAEEDKGLGAFTFDANGVACEQDGNSDPDCFTFDDGKNIKYFTFSMSITDTVGGHSEDTLLANLTQPGHQLNQPEVDYTTGDFFAPRNTSEFWDFGDAYNFNIYNTEIARRGSWLGQDIYKVHKDTSKAKYGLLALPSWKQGQMNQGGPADVMSRRIVLPKNWSLKHKKIGGNPYAFRNMECRNLGETDNPYYPGGLCLDSAINLSSVVPDTCQDSESGLEVPCPQVDLTAGTPFGIGDTEPILQGSNVTPNKTKVLSWHQCPASFTTVSQTEGTTPPPTCATDARTDATTLADQSWYNPLDVAKGHRGFLDGDMVMMLYAWSPNWRLNAKGSDRYELYIRRSFAGATSWGTLPKSYKYWDPNNRTKFGGDGTVTCETFRSDQTRAGGDLVEPRVCNSYAAGAAEQARNVTQLQSMRITTLDPRFAITGSPQGVSNTSTGFGYGTNPYGEDTRDPSRYFVVYETGDNTTTADGEPEPLDLFYSRAVNFGDDYQVWAEETDLSVCYPSDPHDDAKVPEEQVGTGFCNEFDQLEQGTPGLEASEASLTANPGGQFLYGAWAELEIDEDTGEPVASDARARRVWWRDDYISDTWAWDFGQGTGTGVPATP